MPGLDLSTLTAPELRQLLRLARGRRDGLLIDRVEWEIAQRTALESRAGVDLQRKASVLIEDGDVTIDEVRAFRRPEPGLPPRQRGSGRIPAMLGGLVAGSALTAGAFASGFTLPARIEIPALPVITVADRAPQPVVRPKVVESASSDAVAGALAPEPFPERTAPPPPEPPPLTVAEVVPLPPPPEPEPKVEKAKVGKPKALADAKVKPKPKAQLSRAKPDPKSKPKTAVAKTKADAKAKALASKKTPDKSKVAARKADAKSKVAAKTKPKAPGAKTKLAAKDKAATKKPNAKTTAIAKAKPKPTPPKTVLAKAPSKPKAAPSKPAAKPKTQAAATGEARDTIGSLLAETQGGAPPP